MYDIKNLNIWNASSNSNSFKCKEKVLEVEASKRKEISMSEKYQKVFDERPVTEQSESWCKPLKVVRI